MGPASADGCVLEQIDEGTAVAVWAYHIVLSCHQVSFANKKAPAVEWYNEVLGLLYRWRQEQGMPTSIGSIDEMTVREFIVDLQSRPGSKHRTISSHSVYNRVNALRSFFAWLHVQGYTQEHVLKNLKQPRTADVIIEPLTREEVEGLFASINPNTFLGCCKALHPSRAWDFRIADAVHLSSRWLPTLGEVVGP